MRPYNFKFQKILDWREHLETQENHKFAGVLKKYSQKENELNEKINDRAKYLIESREALEKNNFTSSIWRDNARRAFSIGIENNKKELEIERQKLDRARKELIEYTRKKRVMELLKEKDFENFKEEKKRIDKKLTDEVGQNMLFSGKLIKLEEDNI